jgi:glycosyltransferase involved in cell wall biosynthesis
LGCPVVASNVPGASEQLGDAALLVDPKNEEEIALAIKSLVDDRKLNEELVSRGKVRARHWNGESYVRKVFAFLDEFEAIRRCWSSLGRYTPQK